MLEISIHSSCSPNGWKYSDSRRYTQGKWLCRSLNLKPMLPKEHGGRRRLQWCQINCPNHTSWEGKAWRNRWSYSGCWSRCKFSYCFAASIEDVIRTLSGTTYCHRVIRFKEQNEHAGGNVYRNWERPRRKWVGRDFGKRVLQRLPGRGTWGWWKG